MAFRIRELRQSLRPWELHYFPRLRSTNDHAKTLRPATPAIVLTANQTHGRGRGAHTWWSEKGCLTVTFALKLDRNIPVHQIPLSAGVAVRRALVDVTKSERIKLKWPNDLYCKDRKIGGILCERVGGIDLIGIGVNVEVDMGKVPANLGGRIGSLREITSSPVDLNAVLVTIARRLWELFSTRARLPYPSILREYDRYNALRGRCVRVLTGLDGAEISGKCVGIDSAGRLLLQDRAGLHRIISGEVRFR